jgi:superfamily II DNA/RNA helicase
MMTAQSLEHHYVVSEERNKVDMLRRVIRHYKPERAIVFVNATDDIAEVTAKLNHLGLPAAALYGDADKVTRANVLARFRDGKLKVLVASDVAARGLDIENLTLVVSFDPAFDSEHYVHRAGRTGRMGKRGLSVTIVTEQQTFIMRKFARELDIQLDEREMAFGKALTEGERSEFRGGGAGAGRREGSAPRGSEAGPRTGKPQVRTSAAGTAGGTGGEAPAGQPGAAGAGAGAGTVRREQHRPGIAASTRSAASPAGKARSNAERDKNRKNKGAPKWLKNKTPRGDGQ